MLCLVYVLWLKKGLSNEIIINFNIVRFEESMGLYLLTSGMKQKYQDYFERLMEILKERIPEFELNTISSSTDTLSEGLKFCAYCGIQTIKDDQKYCVNCGKEIL